MHLITACARSAWAEGRVSLLHAMHTYLTVKLGYSGLSLPWAVTLAGGYRIIGTVTHGLEFGRLAITPDGQYLQVNGSIVQSLSRSSVCEALRRAGHLQGMGTAAPHAPRPSVIVRKKRRMASSMETT